MARCVFSRAGVLGFFDSEGHVEPAVCKNNSLNVCLVVEDEMDEEDMDHEEEQSEESKAVRVGKRKTTTPTFAELEEHERTHSPCRSWCRHCVAARASNPAHRGRKFAKAVEGDKDMKQVSYDHCLMRDQPGMESAMILVSKDGATRMVSARGAIERSSSLVG